MDVRPSAVSSYMCIMPATSWPRIAPARVLRRVHVDVVVVRVRLDRRRSGSWRPLCSPWPCRRRRTGRRPGPALPGGALWMCAAVALPMPATPANVQQTVPFARVERQVDDAVALGRALRHLDRPDQLRPELGVHRSRAGERGDGDEPCEEQRGGEHAKLSSSLLVVGVAASLREPGRVLASVRKP